MLILVIFFCSKKPPEIFDEVKHKLYKLFNMQVYGFTLEDSLRVFLGE